MANLKKKTTSPLPFSLCCHNSLLNKQLPLKLNYPWDFYVTRTYKFPLLFTWVRFFYYLQLKHLNSQKDTLFLSSTFHAVLDTLTYDASILPSSLNKRKMEKGGFVQVSIRCPSLPHTAPCFKGNWFHCSPQKGSSPAVTLALYLLWVSSSHSS